MQIIEDIQKVTIEPNVATIGFFDGVHLGHNHLIKQVCKIAAQRDMKSLLITFANHPRKVISTDYVPLLLSTQREKFGLLAEKKVDMCLKLHFTEELANLSAKEFMKNYLSDLLNVKVLVVGYDHHFGRGSKESFADYQKYGQEIGIEVIRAEKFALEEEDNVSSSAIRFCLQVGDVKKAAKLLGREYGFSGKVIEGRQIGKAMGFPTANIELDESSKMMPMNGSYAVVVEVQGIKYPGMLYIGNRPTFGELGGQSIEVHILNFAEEIYGDEIHVDFIQRLRADTKFDNVDKLCEQLKQDVQKVEKIIQL